MGGLSKLNNADKSDKNAIAVRRIVYLVVAIQFVVTAALAYIFFSMNARLPQCVYCMVSPALLSYHSLDRI